jgi:hypothetical protein
MKGTKSSWIMPGAIAVVVMALVSSCGGGSNSASTSSGSSTSSSEGKVGKTSAEFLRPKAPNNKYVKFGAEAPTAEREAATKVLEENLKARQDGDFVTQCASLDKATIEELAEPRKGAAAEAACPAALKKLAEPLKSTTKARADTLGGPIAVLRIKGPKAYALYHGNNKTDYSMPMVKEGGSWKVGSLVGSELG